MFSEAGEAGSGEGGVFRCSILNSIRVGRT